MDDNAAPSASAEGLGDKRQGSTEVAREKSCVSGLVDELEAQANRLQSLAGALEAERVALAARLAKFRGSIGERITSRRELDGFTPLCVGPGAFIYLLAGDQEQSDWFCPDCLSGGTAVALRLQTGGQGPAARHVCPRCNFSVDVD